METTKTAPDGNIGFFLLLVMGLAFLAGGAIVSWTMKASPLTDGPCVGTMVEATDVRTSSQPVEPATLGVAIPASVSMLPSTGSAHTSNNPSAFCTRHKIPGTTQGFYVCQIWGTGVRETCYLYSGRISCP